jgi:hypothetical protein
MSTDQIISRHDDLFAVLIYCSDQQAFGKSAVFTAFERICINQERGSLLSQLNKETPESDVRFYQCPPKLESKIRFIIQKVIDNHLITQ